MPKSKSRPHVHHPQQHHDPHHQGANPAGKKSNRVTNVLMVFFAFLGLLISYLTVDLHIPWMLTGAAIGVIAGYFLGKQLI